MTPSNKKFPRNAVAAILVSAGLLASTGAARADQLGDHRLSPVGS